MAGENKGVDARGVEIVGAKVQKAIARGVSVYQGDIEQGLADYPDEAFDYVILSQTLQETRASAEGACTRCCAWAGGRLWRFRISATGACGWRMLLTGQRAQDEAVSARLVRFAEYSLPDGARFRGAGARSRTGRLSGGIFLAGHRKVDVLPNLMSETAVFLVRR